MLADKLRCTDWEATNEAMEEAVARESFLEFLRDREKRARGTRTLVINHYVPFSYLFCRPSGGHCCFLFLVHCTTSFFVLVYKNVSKVPCFGI